MLCLLVGIHSASITYYDRLEFMTFGEGILLGAVQGLTEFIPVSSSGHLVLLHLLGGPTSLDLAIDVLLQLASVLAVIIYFRRDLLRLIQSLGVEARDEAKGGRTLLLALVAGTIPALIAGLLLEDVMETVFRSGATVAVALLFGSALMFLAERRARQGEALSPRKGFLVGLFQALALLPGVSRSGATISGGLLVGFSREEAVRFSFLLSIPILLGTGLKKLWDLLSTGLLFSLGLPLIVSFALSFLFSLLSIHFLISYLKKHSLNIFIVYRILIAALIFILLV
ncbi:undecaprenyl-diphosphatase UppP [Patescibacteria group bacterium]|nr:MAG: undecaprenyl-diphosphatase UppP [Patescibacteria group bacterium]